MWIQRAKVLGHCFLWNKQNRFVLSISLEQGGHLLGTTSLVPCHQWKRLLNSSQRVWTHCRVSSHSIPNDRQKHFYFVTMHPGGVSSLSVCRCRLQVCYCSVRQREEALSAQYWVCCVISFMPSACLLALVRLVILRDPFKGDSVSRVSPSFIPSYSSLNKEPVLASSVNTTKQLSGPSVNCFLWLAMHANLMSYVFFRRNYALPF